MGITFLNVKIYNSNNLEYSKDVQFLVDSGTNFSFVNSEVLKEMGVRPTHAKDFILANGGSIRRKMGHATFQYGENIGVAPVVFAEKDDENLLGATALEAMCLILDPVKRKLLPLKLFA